MNIPFTDIIKGDFEEVWRWGMSVQSNVINMRTVLTFANEVRLIKPVELEYPSSGFTEVISASKAEPVECKVVGLAWGEGPAVRFVVVETGQLFLVEVAELEVYFDGELL